MWNKISNYLKQYKSLQTSKNPFQSLHIGLVWNAVQQYLHCVSKVVKNLPGQAVGTF